jgi:hypothetical protein
MVRSRHRPPLFSTASRLASSLSGGIHCPIVSLYRRIPANWRENPSNLSQMRASSAAVWTPSDPEVLVLPR